MANASPCFSTVTACLLMACLAGCGSGNGNGASSQSAPTAPAPTASLSASPAIIQQGQNSTLTWKTSNSTSVSIQGIGKVAASGFTSVSPHSTYIYKLTANGKNGQSAQAQATITVNAPPPGSVQALLTASPNAIYTGQSTVLRWQTSDATRVTLSGLGAVALNGSWQVSPQTDTSYELTATGPSGSSKSSTTVTVHAPGSIKHVIVMFQENRTTDNLFHDPVLMAEGADIASSGLNSLGQAIPLQPRPLLDTYDPFHFRKQFLEMYDNGKMDGADLIRIRCPDGGDDCYPPNPQFTYVDPGDVAPYFTMAESYTFADRMFQTNQGPSFPAHQFIFSGTSAPSETSDLFAADNPATTAQAPYTGCIAPTTQTVPMIDPEGNEDIFMYPCFEHTTLTDLLDEKGLSWEYFSAGEGSIWTAPNAISHICQANEPGGRCKGPEWSNVSDHAAIILDDIANGTLPNVSWVMPPGFSSDHPGGNDGTGPSWVASVVNAVGHSPYWSDTAIFITWDDWGGLYDHVAPPILNSYEYGFRVPLVIVSPYAKKGYVSHVTHNFGSILKFVEKTFDLPSLGFADAASDDLSDCFDFDQPPPWFKTVPSKVGADFFIYDMRPDVPLDSD